MKIAKLAFCMLLISVSSDSSFAQSLKRITNPILAGFYPDPSICRVGKEYYLVNSTFSYFPGITVFRSEDLVHWNLIGYVLDRPEQLNLEGQGVSRGLFAPAIRYNNGIYYVTCTLVDIGGNFVATTTTPAGPWSNPVWLPEINGNDPSLFFDDNGKAYIIYNSIPPDDKPLYQGHRTIRMFEFDPRVLKVVGKEKLLINGGTDITKKPVWIEGPHILKKDGLYYLVCAEGGTAEQHSEVVFKSRNVDGPYIPYKNNPILTQRDLNPKREHPITCTGHADFVQTGSGDWWAAFLGCRPYKEDFYNCGRETFLAPVKWIDGWPVINPGEELVQYSYPTPMQSSPDSSTSMYSGNFCYRDEFSSGRLDLNWEFLRTPKEKWYSVTDRGFLSLRLRPESCSGNSNPSFLARRQQHAQGTATTAMDFTPRHENEKAGLVVFQNEEHYYFLCKSLNDSGPVVQLFCSGDRKTAGVELELLASRQISASETGKKLFLSIVAKGSVYSFMFATEAGKWIALMENIDATFLSTKIAGGFVGCMYALYATSLGKTSDRIAAFDWFEYQGSDEVYR